MSNVIHIRVLRLTRQFERHDRVMEQIALELGRPVQQPAKSPSQRAYERHQVLLEQECADSSQNKPDLIYRHPTSALPSNWWEEEDELMRLHGIASPRSTPSRVDHQDDGYEERQRDLEIPILKTRAGHFANQGVRHLSEVPRIDGEALDGMPDNADDESGPSGSNTQ